MKYPDILPAEKEKCYWSNSDCFSADTEAPVRVILHRDYSIGMHSHEFYEINIVLSGSGCHYIEGKKHEVGAGDVFVIPSEIHHGYISGNKLDVYHFLVRNDFFTKYRSELEGTKGYNMLFDIEPLLRKSTENKSFLHFDSDEFVHITNEIQHINSARDSCGGLYMTVRALAFFCRLCIAMYESVEKTVERNDTDIIEIMDYINSNYSERITVDNLARLVNMSKSTLNRHFKRAVGITPVEYVIKCRTKRAKELIEENAYTKAEIAQMCGFYDSSHMDKYL